VYRSTVFTIAMLIDLVAEINWMASLWRTCGGCQVGRVPSHMCNSVREHPRGGGCFEISLLQSLGSYLNKFKGGAHHHYKSVVFQVGAARSSQSTTTIQKYHFFRKSRLIF
jgi:hypothetical protein